jgi:phthiocerol/phenolphthiocerol synthesis type-I polyketide synthase E
MALTLDQTSQIDNARRLLQTSSDELLLTALARTIAGAVGDGVAAVDLAGAGRSVLRPEVDLRRTVGSFATIHPIALPCVTNAGASATQLLEEVSHAVQAVPHHGIGYGLLRYLHAPTAAVLAAGAQADVFFTYLGMVPEWQQNDARVQLYDGAAELALGSLPGLGHPLELRAYRHGGVLHVDWWYDSRRVAGSTVEALAQQFPATLIGLIDEAVSGDELDDEDDAEDEALALVDLSAAVFDDDE